MREPRYDGWPTVHLAIGAKDLDRRAIATVVLAVAEARAAGDAFRRAGVLAAGVEKL